MAELLTAEQIADYREAFSACDKKGHGTVSTRELGTVLRSLGQNPSETELQTMINEVDGNGNGMFDLPDLLSLMAHKMQETANEEEYREAFRVFDQDGKGYIDKTELRYILSCIPDGLTDDELDELFQTADVNKDGKIVYSEFAKLMTQTHS